MIDRREFLRLAALTGAAVILGCQQSPAKSTPSPIQSPEAIIEKNFQFIVRNRRPKDLETPVEAFETYLTPNDIFFVRSHHPEPRIKEKDWSLTISGGASELIFKLDDLKKREATTVTAVLQCSGNSRNLYRPQVPGVQWGKGAAGNAEWTGVRLTDVLKEAGIDQDSPPHVVVQGADKPLMSTVPLFIRQLPLHKCLHPDTLLAYEMNGEPLPRLHGGPVRLVVPGWVGDDWMKWLTSIKVQKVAYDGFYYKQAYRFPTEFGEPGEPVDHELMEPMTELVTRSLISRPAHGQSLQMGESTVRGVAWTGGEALITRVEVSDDEGETWTEATLEGEAKPYAWRLWSVAWTPKTKGSATLWCRATDSRNFTQSLEPSPWNPSGYLWGSADSIRVEVSG